MSINTMGMPLLYSMGTRLAYTIAENYYYNKHFVWCTSRFHSDEQAPTSDPLTIGKTYLSHATRGDRHSQVIKNNIAGILRGASEKHKEGVIDDSIYVRIQQIVNCADYEAFAPVLYIINTDLVKDRCIEVPPEERASNSSIEYNIIDLSGGEFQIINFRDLLTDVVRFPEKRFGE